MDKEIIEIRNANRNFAPMEAFKTLRTNLLYTEDLKVIALTSSTPDEGKTITAFHLANSFAQMGKKVCLVDCDLRRSSLNDYLMLNKRYSGLSEALTKQTKSYIRSTNVDNLFIVLSGKKPPNPSEILSSQSFDKVINELKKTFDYVIIDTPPVTVSMDATIVGRQADGVVLVVRNEFTKKKQLKRIKTELERNNARIVGVVLNRVKKNQLDYSGYSYEKYY